jgi:hypothetical protein
LSAEVEAWGKCCSQGLSLAFLTASCTSVWSFCSGTHSSRSRSFGRRARTEQEASTEPKGDRVGVSDSAASARGEHGAGAVHGGSGLPSSAEALASNFHNLVWSSWWNIGIRGRGDQGWEAQGTHWLSPMTTT